MRVIAVAPEGWQWVDGSTCVVPAPPAIPEVVVQVGPLVVCPEDLAAWKHVSACAHAPAPSVSVTEGETPFVTETGWPAVRLRLTFATPAGDIVEHRVVVFYQFLHTVAAVVARSLSAAPLLARQDELRRLFVGAQPDFDDGEPVSLLEFWK